MCGIEHSEETAARLARVIRHENDTQKRVATFDSGLLSNPLHIPDDRVHGEDLVPLSNLVNVVVRPESVAISLLGASELGRQNMTSFISARIQSNQTNFWDSVKLNIPTFSSVTRKVTVESQKDKVVSINADCDVFGHLLVVAKKREVLTLKVERFFPLSCAAYPWLFRILMVAYGRRRQVVMLMNFLEKDVTFLQNLPSSQLPTAYLVNSMALIQMLKAAGSSTFGELSQKYEAIVTSAL